MRLSKFTILSRLDLKIPLIDLSVQHKVLRKELERAVQKVMDSQHFIQGDCVRALEEKTASKVDSKYAVAVASGSDALYLSLWALGIGPGDEVITSPFTFFATAGSISRVGAKPVFTDIDPCTFNLDVNQIGAKITRRTKAILPVHLFGLCCEMDRIQEIAKRHSLFVIEDAAQAFGSACHGKKAGSIGDAGCFSFYPTKNLGGAGDGGMVVTNSRVLADKIRLLGQHGSKKKYHHELVGINSRLDEIQAAILLVKMRFLDRWNSRRAKIAARYNSGLKGLPLGLPVTPPGFKHIYHLYSIMTRKRDALAAHLEKREIGTGVYYPHPLHLEACFKALGYRNGDFPVAEETSRQILSLPVYPELTESNQAVAIAAIQDFFTNS